MRAIDDGTRPGELSIDFPLKLEDLRSSAAVELKAGWLGIPVEEGAATLEKRVSVSIGGTRLVDLQDLGNARATIVRHLEGYTDANLREAAAQISEARHHLTAGQIPAGKVTPPARNSTGASVPTW